jgi:methylmalonyl-CoA mutase C-terminal domain/subunit
VKGRILIAKVGLDGHEAGAKLIASFLRDAGYEVIYLGTRNTPEQVVSAAVDEDVDLIGISLLSGIHRQVARELCALLRERGLATPVVMGGIIPPQDVPDLVALGVERVFGPAASTRDVVAAVDALVVGEPVASGTERRG